MAAVRGRDLVFCEAIKLTVLVDPGVAVPEMAIETIVDTLVPSAPKAIRALDIMEQELDSAQTYDSISKIIKKADAYRHLLGHIAAVKQRAEWVVLLGNRRIAAEIAKVPKASGRPAKISSPEGRNNSGRGATGIPAVSRHRLKKLAEIEKPKLKEIANQLWSTGKDATLKAIIGETKEAEIKENRVAFESRRESGATVSDLEDMAEAGLRFPVIYADPPWEFKVYSGKGKQRSAERHYDTSSIEAICKLPVARLAEDDCALFLWAVWPELPGALEVIKAWGFEYKTAAFAWVKETSTGAAATGMGYWTRANSEVCLLATRGHPRRAAKDVHQIITSPVGEHSAKPAEARRRIERLLIGPYLELFARHPVNGWHVWGNEIPAT